MRPLTRASCYCLLPAILFAVPQAIPAAEELSRLVAPMNDPAVFGDLQGELKPVPEGPDGATVLRADGRFEGRIDLKRLGIEPKQYDLIKIQLKADARATLVVSLENHPAPGQLSHWYLFSKARDAFPWETAWIDLGRPEEIKQAGSYKGMDSDDPSLRGLRMLGFVGDSHRAAQPPDRRIWLGPVRFLRKAVDLDWDQRQAPYQWQPGKDLVYRYAVQLTNRLDRPVTAAIKFLPLDVKHATATVAADRITLAPAESKTVVATLTLPAKAAAASPPLYCERFLALAGAEGIDDSQVTILRSSDPAELSVTVPIDEAKLQFPLLPRRKDLPEEVTGFSARNREQAERLAEAARPEDLQECMGEGIDHAQKGVWRVGLYADKNEASKRYSEGLTAAAFLYDLTGDRKYLDKGTALLKAAADAFPKHLSRWQQDRATVISHGILAFNTLRLGWATGSMRSPYAMQRHGMFNDFDLLAPGMDPQTRRHILDNFIVPAAIQMRNHTFGLGNQQDVVNYAVLYAGLAARNWPLVAFAYSSDYGLRNQIAWDFDDEGLAGEGHYHTPALRPVLYATELLYHRGIDLYDQRLHLITHSPGADAVGKPFRDAIVAHLDAHRFQGKPLARSAAKTDGVHLSTGITSLRWNDLEVAMNWGTQIHRGAADRCALRISAPERNPLSRVGGGNYSHSSIGQSIIIVDEGLQQTVPADVTGHDVTGPVQFVQAASPRHYPGSTITRTFALLGEHVLVLDRVASDRPRTVDWCLRYPGGGQAAEDVAKTVELAMEHRHGSFTDKPSDRTSGVNFGRDLKSQGYFVASTDRAWRQSKGQLMMAGQRNTQVMVFAVPAAFSAAAKERTTGVPVLMVRRKGVQVTDFVAGFSPKIKRMEQLAVEKSGGGIAQAVGVKVTLEDGAGFYALANYESAGVEVLLGPLKTRDRFATDYRAP